MKRVLLIERDSLHRELIREWLVTAGVQVVDGAPFGQAAPATPVAAGIDALLIDVASREEAHAILRPWRRAYRHSAIVVLSGRFCRAESRNDATAARLGVTCILAKPFTQSELWTALGLGSPPPAVASTPKA